MSMEPGGRKPLDEQLTRPNQLIPWVAVIGVLVTGVAGLIGGIRALSDASSVNPLAYTGGGACLAASGLAFGLLTNAIFRR
jgi:hypothetical protein